MPVADNEYDRRVDCWLGGALDGGVADFPSLLRTLPGVYPTDVVAALNRVVASSGPNTCEAGRLLADARTPGTPYLPSDIEWQRPVPHPLDYDWRFSTQTAEHVAQAAVKATPPLGLIVLLGTPSVLRAARQLEHSARVTLLDLNQNPDGELRQWVGDVAVDPLPPLAAATVVIDPPWYPNHFRSFLWAASFVAVGRARLFCGVPAVGTRPGIDREWLQLIDEASEYGWRLERLDRGALEYLTPPFETNALRAAGITNASSRWRRADLATFVRAAVPLAVRPVQPETVGWVEEQLGTVRWRLRICSPMNHSSPELRSLVPGDVLSNVSRRDPLRARVTVWTSGNRIFHCENLHLLREILRALKSGVNGPDELFRSIRRRSPASFGRKELEWVEATGAQIRGVQEAETGEYGR